MADRKLTVRDVFWAYNELGLIHSNNTIWIHFDREFVRLMNEKSWKAKDLAKAIGVSWNKLNCAANRDDVPKWMTPLVLMAMVREGFDIGYILKQPVTTLTREEYALLDNYRNSTPDSQAAIRKIGAALEKQDEEVMQRIITRG